MQHHRRKLPQPDVESDEKLFMFVQKNGEHNVVPMIKSLQKFSPKTTGLRKSIC